MRSWLRPGRGGRLTWAPVGRPGDRRGRRAEGARGNGATAPNGHRQTTDISEARTPRARETPSPEASSPASPPDGRSRTYVTRAARRDTRVHRQPRPPRAGGPTTTIGSPLPPVLAGGKEGKRGRGSTDRRAEGRGNGANRNPKTGPQRRGESQTKTESALRGTKATDACDCPSRGDGERLRLIAKRPSDRRSPGRNPGPQGAFEVSMINVSCNSH